MPLTQLPNGATTGKTSKIANGVKFVSRPLIKLKHPASFACLEKTQAYVYNGLLAFATYKGISTKRTTLYQTYVAYVERLGKRLSISLSTARGCPELAVPLSSHIMDLPALGHQSPF